MEKYPNIALKLFQRGWVTVPANGKRCLIKGWQHYGKKPFITENDIREFSTKHAQSKFGTNTSHVFGPDSPLVAIDIDISDHATTKRVAIAAWLGINRSTIYRYVEDGTFPKPVKLSPRRQVFIKEQVIKWFHDRQNSDNELPALPEADSEI